MIKLKLARPTVLVFCCAALSFARADVLLYEPFEYLVGDGIDGQNGGLGFGTSAWTDNSPANDVIREHSLSYSSLDTDGNSAKLTGPTQNDRNITPIVGTNDQTTWISFLLHLENENPVVEGAFLTIRPNSSGQAAQFGVFLKDGNLFFGIGASQGSISTPVLSSATFESGLTCLVVASVTWKTATSAAEQISLFVNPTLGETPPLVADISRNDLNMVTGAGTNRIFNIIMSGRGAGNKWVFDEIRIGNTFADVVPVPESSTIALLGLGLVALLRRGAARQNVARLR